MTTKTYTTEAAAKGQATRLGKQTGETYIVTAAEGGWQVVKQADVVAETVAEQREFFGGEAVDEAAVEAEALALAAGENCLDINTDLVAQVRAHAEARGSKYGWDLVTECYTDAQIAQAIGKARTLKGAIAKLVPATMAFDRRRREEMANARAEGGDDIGF